ncbi:Hypothetical predicted protein [Olea europaea subsp. europaea]|uniref:BZIP transcription factor n=1 Tax=Olea europaea subsp. europaea TaxID=158383 RepID=A0A8S0VLW3_OLEEU|nr:Hypothetical predicted protein [Olea europaea subsp. europaea]
MGATNSKSERSDALRLCRERKRFIKQAIDSRYGLAAAHVSYVQSLRNIGIALRRYAEAEVLIESALSASATENDKTPSHSSYLSHSSSHIAGALDSPVLNGSPLSPPTARVSYMRSGGASALTVRVSPPPRNTYIEEIEFSMPPPPPPPPELGSSWDFFDPADENESFRLVGQNGLNLNFDDVRMYGDFGEKGVDLDNTSGIQDGPMAPKSETRRNGHSKLVVSNSNSATCEKNESSGHQRVDGGVKDVNNEIKVNGLAGSVAGKASESIRKEYDRRCDQLQHQFAKDLSPQTIDKTRAVVKDLHSRIRVALHAVDSISKRIEKMWDEELFPQIMELIQGLARMWKAMLKCHHNQYITISLAYHAKTTVGIVHGKTHRQIINQLLDEVEYFGLSFADWINSYTSYVEALNSWLQNCILQPRERQKGRRAFSPRRALAPPIFVLCRDWSTGIKYLPSEEVSDAIKGFLSDLLHSVRHQQEESQEKATTEDLQNNEESESKHSNDEEQSDDRVSNLSGIQTSLTKVLDWLTKFSEASVKMCNDIQKKCEAAQNAYDNYRAPPRSFNI